MPYYESISPALEQEIQANRKIGWVSPYACPNAAALRRSQRPNDMPTMLRPPFSKDADKILNSAFYNRYADKTQVFSFYRNDDISRRALHVQLVSRIARNIGDVLGLNTDLIEAIAIGHDMGHTPFGHAGELALNKLYQEYTGKRFLHNLHGVRVLDTMVPYNISLQTLDGILCHNGELPQAEYYPAPMLDFAAFDARIADCYKQEVALIPCTLEGCLVRLCDMIAYIGKDRQDAIKAKLVPSEDVFSPTLIGKTNAEVINNLEVNLIENSYGKPFLQLDQAHFQAMKQCKDENYRKLYYNENVQGQIQREMVPMMEKLYEKIRKDAIAHDRNSALYQHHIALIEEKQQWYPTGTPYDASDPDDLTTDFIAAMTDDYFVDYFRMCFPKSKHRISYIDYFNGTGLQYSSISV